MRTLIGSLLLALLLIAAGLLAAILYLSSVTFPLSGKVQLPLPAAIGGAFDVAVQGELSLAPLRLEAGLAGRITVEREALNAALPAESYSILESSVDSERIASLLGRLAFVEDSVQLDLRQADAIVAGGFSGQFFVREHPPDAAVDIPGAGESVPVSGRIEAVIERPRLTRDWKVRADSIGAALELDGETVARLAGRFGRGDEFSRLLSELLNERLAGHAGRFRTIEIDLRDRINRRIAAAVNQYARSEPLRQIRKAAIESVKVDGCPQLEQQGLSLGFAIRISYDPLGDGAPIEIPDIELVQASCPNGWDLSP